MVASPIRTVNSARASVPSAPMPDDGFDADRLRALSPLPLFEPIAALLDEFCARSAGELDALNAMLACSTPPVLTRSNRRVRFTAPSKTALPYELAIDSLGEVPTRPGNWHDFFNALVWLRFPQAKAALNALHVDEMRQGETPSGRGPLRDAATQFDESGIVVLSTDPSLFELLAQRRWQHLFWQRRSDVVASMRFLVFGHGLYDALRAPFYRICGRAAFVCADAAMLAAGTAAQCRHADAVLAERFAARTHYRRPKSLMALPLLGIPGVCAQNACEAYYADPIQFQSAPQER